MSTELLLGILAIGGTIITGFIALMGRKDETSEKHTNTLITGQATRITGLEARLDSVEVALQETRVELADTKRSLTRTEKSLWRFQEHSEALRDALERALAWIAEAVEWITSDRTTEPPTPPDSTAWRKLVNHRPEPPND